MPLFARRQVADVLLRKKWRFDSKRMGQSVRRSKTGRCDACRCLKERSFKFGRRRRYDLLAKNGKYDKRR